MKVAIPYGAFELKRAYQRNFSIALLVAVIVYLLLISSFMFFSQIDRQKPIPVKIPIILKPEDFGPPPSVTRAITPEVLREDQGKTALPSAGVPRAVPDEQVQQTSPFTSQQDLANLHNPGVDLGGTSDGETLIIQVPEGYIPPSDTFIPYDEAPVLVKEVKPGYPELARRSGMEGRVYVQAWVDKHGKVKEAKCLREGSVNLDIFCESAIQAAKQNEYKPAISNKVPVPCWVTYKVDFVLR